MSLDPANLAFVRDLVRRRSAVVLESDKDYLVETRLEDLARRQGVASAKDLVRQVRAQPGGDLERQAVEVLLTSETSFFRDFHPFECLRLEVLPELIRRRASERALRVWCAACASGQEPYSVAMLLREDFPQVLGWDLQILASDLSAELLDRARQGVYRQLEVNRGLPARFLVKYFRQRGGEWLLADEVRRMVEFRQHNLAADWPLPAMDVILLRNVLIYFDVATKQAVLAKVRRVLRPDGCLLLGGAETTLNLDPAFARVPCGRSSYYRLVSGSERQG